MRVTPTGASLQLRSAVTSRRAWALVGMTSMSLLYFYFCAHDGTAPGGLSRQVRWILEMLLAKHVPAGMRKPAEVLGHCVGRLCRVGLGSFVRAFVVCGGLLTV